MNGRAPFMLLAVFVLSLASACGRQTVTESVLSSDQTLSQTIEVETEPGAEREDKSVRVAVEQPNMALQTNVTRYAGRTLNGLEGMVPAERLLSPYAERVAFTMSPKDGPNCWHTSIASIFHKWTESRYMHDAEFSCHVTTWFREVKDPKFGDLIRFLDDKGEELHGATFIGIDKATQEAVVFTKNGYSSASGWGFMTFADLKEVYAEFKSVKFYTPVEEALEPVRAGMKCRAEFVQSQSRQKDMDRP